MSIASPNLRSSSTTAPRPSFNSWLTCMVALPSTALTVTGMSYTASSSRAPRGEFGSLLEPAPSASSASSISVAIGHLLDRCQHGHDLFPQRRGVARRHPVPPDHPDVAWRHRVTGHRLHTRRKLRVEPRDLFRDSLRRAWMRTHGDARLLCQSRHDYAHERAHLGLAIACAQRWERRIQAIDQKPCDRCGGLLGARRGQLAFLSKLRGDHRRRFVYRRHAVCGRFPQTGRMPVAPRGLARFTNLPEGICRLDHLRLDHLRLGHCVGQIKILGEQQIPVGNTCEPVHGQYTISSSWLSAISIAPCAASSFATTTMLACASSTSRSLTGPSASISSFRILPARSDMFLKNMSRSLSDAPFIAIGSLSFSTARSSTCTACGVSRSRSSKVNISALMRSAASRLRSSKAARKRVSD